MSRYVSVVSVANAATVFGIPMSDMETILGHDITEGDAVAKVAHGYDKPCESYFCDLMPDCEIGIYYGGIGVTTKLGKTEYSKALLNLGLGDASKKVCAGIRY